MTTIKDIAKRANVAISTVSNVINESSYVSPELKKRVKRAMEELDYQPNEIARSMVTNKTSTLGLLVSNISSPFFSRVVKGAEDKASEKNYRIVIGNTHEEIKPQKSYLKILARNQVDGIILTPSFKGGESENNLEILVDNKIPFVLIDRDLQDIDASSVLSDNVKGAYKATNYLIENGHRKIGFISGIKGATTTKERFMGYKEAFEEYDFKWKDSWVFEGDFTVNTAYKATLELLSQNSEVSAIFGINGLTVVGILQALKSKNLNCPSDISVVGFDNYSWTSVLSPPITAVEQVPYEIGYRATSLLISKLNEKEGTNQKIRTPTSLIIRDSVKKLSK